MINKRLWPVIILLLIIIIVLVIGTGDLSSKNNAPQCSGEPIWWIYNLSDKKIVSLVKNIKTCADEGRSTTINLVTAGGSVKSAMLFYDLLNTTDLHKYVTIIASGETSSAGLIVLASADTRIGLPSTGYLWHESTTGGGSVEERAILKEFCLNASTKVLKHKLGKTLSKLWYDYLSGEKPQKVLTSEDMLEIGFIQKIIPYQ